MEKNRHYRGLLVFLGVVIVVGFGWLLFSDRGDLPPEPGAPDQASGNIGGLAFRSGDVIPDNYAPPWDIFNDNEMIFAAPEDVFLEPRDDRFSVDLSVNHPDGLVYNRGYVFVDNAWEEFLFPGNTVGGSWIIGKASYSFQSDDVSSKTHYVVSFSCKKHDNEWKCGCRSGNDCGYWMLQSVNVTACHAEEFACDGNKLYSCVEDAWSLSDECEVYEMCNADKGACTLPEAPTFCGDGLCEGDEASSCPEDCAVILKAIGVSAGSYHTCVLKSDGNVDCYGNNDDGQSADYLGGDAISVSEGFRHTCVLKSDGNVDCYGRNEYGQSEDYLGGDAISVSTGDEHTCVLKSDGNVDCYGHNGSGQIVDYLGGDAISVSTGNVHTCVLKSDGNVDCNGNNDYNQSEDYLGGDAVDVSAGTYITCVLKSDGNVNCYGNNYDGQSEDYMGGDVIEISTGGYHTCVLKSDGNVDCYGFNEYGQTEDYLGGDAISISVGTYHTCVLKSDGNVDCYGLNNHGQSEDFVAGEEECTDSDGKDYYVRGLTEGRPSSMFNGNSTRDSCDPMEENKVIEFYCGSEREILLERFQCPYGCEDGACISDNSTSGGGGGSGNITGG